MIEIRSDVATSNLSKSVQHSIEKSIFLHFMPALIWLIFYVPLAWIANQSNIPSMLIMYVVGASVLLPVELGYLYYLGKKKNKKFSLKGIVLYRKKMPWWQYLVFGLIICVWMIVTLFLFGSQLAELLRTHLFSWIPDWFYLNIGSAEQNGPFIESTMMILGLVFTGLIGPLTEELYFRGYLLPRLSKYGKWAPLLNAVLFIAYHFWQPHFLLTGIIATLPLVYFVWWKKNIYLGIGIHCFLNTFGWVVALVQKLGSP